MKKYWILSLLISVALYAQIKKPTNIIILLGDGMGFEHIKAAQYYWGEDSIALKDLFPVHFAAQTSSWGVDYDAHKAWTDKMYVTSAFTESAASATAISTGTITQHGMLGLSADSIPFLHIAELAYALGKASGVVTTVPFPHATPAGFAVHYPNRKSYIYIAYEMIFHSPLQLLMGTGHPFFDNDGKPTNQATWKYIDLALWKYLFSRSVDTIKYAEKTFDKRHRWFATSMLDSMDTFIAHNAPEEKLFYLAPIFESTSYARFGQSQLPYDVSFPSTVPRLKQLTERALRFLSKDQDGFFLMVEGGAIDWASHDNNLPRLIEETQEFLETVNFVKQWLDSTGLAQNTLLIVIADHETGLLCKNFTNENGFEPIEFQGKGKLPHAKFLSTDHTNMLVPFFAAGPGIEVFKKYLTHTDPKKGQFLHIANVSDAVKTLWGQAAYLYPRETLVRRGQTVTFHVASPLTEAHYQWYVNNRLYPLCKSYSCSIKINKPTTVQCRIVKDTHQISSNVVRVTVF